MKKKLVKMIVVPVVQAVVLKVVLDQVDKHLNKDDDRKAKGKRNKRKR